MLPDVSGLAKTFDYVVPEHLRDHVRVGSMVRADLHGRRIAGWVTGLPGLAELPIEQLKPLAKWSGHGPSAEVVDLARWVAFRWAGRQASVLRSASPERMVAAIPAARYTAPTPRQPNEQALRLLESGGGVLRQPPAADPLSAVAAAVMLGPTLVIVPSAAAASVAAARLRGAGVSVALWPRDWASAAGGVDVVIGARSAVLSTAARLSSIVVLDEHDEAMQEERNPTWHARDVAIERGVRLGIPVLVTSPCPTMVARYQRRLVTPTRHAEREGWPIVDVVDRSDEPPWKSSLISSRLTDPLRSPSVRVVCVINTTGRSGRLACGTCTTLIVCERCAGGVSQSSDGTLVCRRCQNSRPGICQACGSLRMKALRPGVSRLREELERAAGRPVADVTKDTPDGVVGSADILVGTEAVLHRAGHADVVAFLDTDTELMAPRGRAAEQTMALLVRAARLLGPRRLGGRLIVQTRLADHPVIRAVANADPSIVEQDGEDAETRRLLGLAPFGQVAALSGRDVERFAAAVAAAGATVRGPADGAYLAFAPDATRLAEWLAAARAGDGDQRVRVAVDPPRL